MRGEKRAVLVREVVDAGRPLSSLVYRAAGPTGSGPRRTQPSEIGPEYERGGDCGRDRARSDGER